MLEPIRDITYFGLSCDWNGQTEQCFKMNASIIINTCNRAGHLRRLLPGLRHLEGVDFEVVVVNGPSTDNTDAVLARYADWIKVRQCPVMNLSVSRNIGIAAASGDVLVFIDDDAQPADTLWLKRYVDAFEKNEQLGGAGGAVLAYDSQEYEYLGGGVTGYGFLRFDTVDPEAKSPDEEPWVERAQGCNAAFLRKALVEVGGYDEFFRFWLDETDVYYRLHKAGYAYAFITDNAVRHYPTRTLFKMGLPPEKWSTITRSDTYYAIKNGPDSWGKRVIKTIVYAWQKYYCRIIRDCAKRGELSFAERWKLRVNWLKGFLAGFYYGLFYARKTGRFKKTTDPFKSCPGKNRDENQLCIALLTNSIPIHAGCGGIGRYTYDLALGLHQCGHEVHILCRDEERLHYQTLGFVIHGISEQEINCWSPMGRYPVENHNLCYGMAVQQRVTDLLKAGVSIDVVHATNWDAEALAVIKTGRIPVVLTLVTSLASDIQEMQWDYDEEKRACITMDYWQIEHAHQLCAPSKGVLESYHTLMGVPEKTLADVSIVPLGIVPIEMPPEGGTPNAKEWFGVPPSGGVKAEDSDEKILLFVGRCERRKGIHVLLDVLPDLLRRFPGWRCLIVGDDTIPDTDGRSFKEAFLQDSSVDICSRIEFQGRVKEKVLYEHYRSCDIFVAPSLFESFGLIYLEAMQFGKPVVGCSVGGVPEVVRDGVDGLLVEPENASALSDALCELMKDSKKRDLMGTFGRERVMDYFTHLKMAERYETVYQKLIKDVVKPDFYYHKRFGEEGARIAMVTLCLGEHYKKMMAPGIRSKEEYCAHHGYDFFVGGEDVYDASRPHSWSKLTMVKKILPDYDYVFFSDSDVVIVNGEIKLTDLVKNDMGDKNFMITRDAIGNLNMGNFFVRKDDWSFEFLDRMYAQTDFIDDPWWENRAFIYLYDTDRTVRNHIQVIEKSSLFNRYLDVKDPYNEDIFPKDDFLIHLAGFSWEGYSLEDIGKIMGFCYEHRHVF